MWPMQSPRPVAGVAEGMALPEHCASVTAWYGQEALPGLHRHPSPHTLQRGRWAWAPLRILSHGQEQTVDLL